MEPRKPTNWSEPGTVLKTKVRIPDFGTRRPRPQVQDLLLQALDHPVVLVSAPAGYGKTSALAELAGQRGEMAWLGLTPEDDDPVRFWTGVTYSCLSAFGSPGGPWQALLEASSNLPVVPGDLAALAAEALGERPGPSLLVWDDVQELRNLGLLDSVTRFLELLPDRTTVVLVSRVDPPLPLSRWRVRGRLGEIRAQDLRFTDDEGMALLQGVTDQPWDPPVLRTLLDKLEGWPAGLRLAALSLAKAPDPGQFVKSFSGSHRLVLEYLTDEVLARQSEALREFLLTSAVFDRWCPALLAAVGGLADSEALLRQTEAADLFLVPLDAGGQWFRYHHLFTETLRARLRIVDPPREKRLLEAAALWFEDGGDPESALELWSRAGAPGQVARCLGKIDFLAKGQLSTLASRLDSLAPGVLGQFPRLADQAAWVKFFQGQRDEAFALTTLVQGWAQSWSDEDRTRSQGSAAALRAFDAMFRGRVDLAVQEALQADQWLAAEDLYPRSILPYVLGHHSLGRGDLDEADRQFGRITEIGEALGSIWTISQGYFEQGVLAFHRGDLARAAERVQVALDRADQRGAGSYGTLGRVRALHAALLYEGDRLDEAEAILAPLVRTRANGLALANLEALVVQVQVDWSRGDRPGAAWADLVERARGGRVLPRIRAQVEGLRLLIDAQAGPPTPCPDVLGDLELGWCWARRFWAQGDLVQAETVARGLWQRAQAGGWELWSLRAGLLISQVEQKLGRSPEGGAPPFLEQARRRGMVRSLADLGPAPGAVVGIPRLSPREQQVLVLVAQGRTNREVADRLFVSEATVKTHIHHMATRLEAPNRQALVARAREVGLLPR